MQRSRCRPNCAFVILGLACLFQLHPVRSQDLQVGYSVINASPGQPVPVASALFSYRINGILVAEAGVGAVEPIRSGRVFVDQRGADTGIAWANASDRNVQLTLVLRNSAGQEVGQKTQSLPAGSHVARFVSQFFPGTPATFTGSLTFTTAGPLQRVAAVTIRQGQNRFGEPIFATLPVADLESPGNQGQTSLVFPHIGAGGPLSTQIILINPGSDSLSGTIRLTDSAGSPLNLTSDNVTNSEFPYDLGPHATFQTTLTSSSGVSSGYAVVTLEQGSALPVGTAIFQFRDGQSIVSEAGVGAVLPTTQARIFVDNVDTQTGVAIASPGNSRFSVEFRLLDRHGFLIDKAFQQLPAGGHIGIFADQIFPDLLPSFTGMLEIRSTKPIVPITLKLSQNSRKDLILTTLPVADMDRPVTQSSVVLPQVGFGLGFSTRLIMISTASSILEGSLRFTNSNGTPMQLPMTGDFGSEFEYFLANSGSSHLRPGNSLGVAQIIVDPSGEAYSEVVVNLGNAVPVRPLVLDTAGNPRDDFTITYASNSPDIATVNYVGRVNGVSKGFSTLTIAAGGKVVNSTITVVDVTSGISGFTITGVAQDQSRRLYLADSSQHVVLLAEDLADQPAVYAGKSGNPGLLNKARLQSLFDGPSYLAIDKLKSEIYVSDAANNVIRLIEPGPDGQVRPLAGSGTAGGTDGALLQARFRNPQGVVLDDRGFLWVVDSGNHTIRRIDLQAGQVATVAGRNGTAGFQDGTGTAARFKSPTGIALVTESVAEKLERELAGGAPPPIAVVVADTGNGVIRQVREDGLVQTLEAATPAGSFPSARVPFAQFQGPTGVAVDPFGNVYVTEPNKRRVSIILKTGGLADAVETRTFSRPQGITIDQTGKIVVGDSGGTAAELSYGSPVITSTAPSRVLSFGGQAVSVRGKNFSPDTQVVVSNKVIRDVQVRNTKLLYFVLPPVASGRTTLSVMNRGGIAQTVLVVEAPPLDELQVGHIATVAGGSTFAEDGVDARAASLSTPGDIALDTLGNLIISDSTNHRIRKVDARTGIITTLAGSGRNDFSGDGKLALAAAFSWPAGIAIDRAGAVLIADSSNNRIRRVDPATGIVDTVAGSGSPVSLGDGGPATEAALLLPGDVATDTAGNFYIADSLQHRIRRVDTNGTITTVAGNGTQGFSGDNASALQASLNSPAGVEVDSEGNIYIADTDNHRIRRVNAANGVITTVAGNGLPGFAGDNGSATNARLAWPEGIAIDLKGNLLIADTNNGLIRKVDGSGKITTLAGGGAYTPDLGDGGPSSSAYLSLPEGLTVDAGGNVVIADTYSDRVRSVSAKNLRIQTIAGSGQVILGDGGPATEANIAGPADVAFDNSGNLLIGDQPNQRIRSVDLNTGIIETVAGGGEEPDGAQATSAQLYLAAGIDIDNVGNLYIADAYFVRKVDAVTGLISTIAGGGSPSDGLGDFAPALGAAFSFVVSLAVDGIGYVYVVDPAADRVRRINPLTGLIETVAGGGLPLDGLGDGLPGSQAQLSFPSAAAVDPNGNLLITDTFNNRVRKVDFNAGKITTVAGNGGSFFDFPTPPLGDNGPATKATVNLPTGIVADNDGNFFISDLTGLIRRVDAKTGIITTVAGGGDPEDKVGDNGPALEAALNISIPSGLAVSPDGDLLISDTSNKRVRIVRGIVPAGPVKGSTRISVFSDDVEGPSEWTRAGGTGPETWTLVNNYYTSPTHSWFAEDHDTSSDQLLTLKNPVSLPANADEAILTFWHYFDFEENFDGGVVEVSTDNGQTWLDAGPAMFNGAYNGSIGAADSPIFGRSAFTGLTPDAPGNTFTAIDLTSLLGEEILIRFRAVTDSAVGGSGWYVDDIIVSVFRYE